MTSRAAHRSEHDSRGVSADSEVSRGTRAARLAGGLTVAAGALAVLAATFLPVLRIEIAGRVRSEFDRTGWDLHGPALVLLALAALALLIGALRGSLPAALAVDACGLAVLGFAVIGDLPDVGTRDLVESVFTIGTARAGSGAQAEVVGGVLLLLGGGILGFAAWSAAD